MLHKRAERIERAKVQLGLNERITEITFDKETSMANTYKLMRHTVKVSVFVGRHYGAKNIIYIL